MEADKFKKFEVIPAIDLFEGRCVRLTKGSYSTVKEYSSDPAEVAKTFAGAGYKRLHIVDLEGAKSSRPVNLRVLERICSIEGLEIQFGGGIKSYESARLAFEAGATDIICGSIAVESSEVFGAIVSGFGPEWIIAGVDVRDEKVSVKGWTEQTDKTIYDVIESITAINVLRFICTDISKDGLLEGPATMLYRKLRSEFPEITLIASGGISSVEDIYDIAETGADGIIVGKAFYENRIDAKDLMRWLQKE